MIYRKWYNMAEDIQFIEYVPGVVYGRCPMRKIFRRDGAVDYLLSTIDPAGIIYHDPRLDLYLTENLDIYTKSEWESRHGRHRQADPQNHNHSVGQSNQSPGGAQANSPGGALTAQQNSFARAYQNALMQSQMALMQQRLARQGLGQILNPHPCPNTGSPPTESLPTERGPMQVGEIIGHRVWRVINGYLASMYVDECLWMPHKHISGDVARGYGVHAFKEPRVKFTEYAMYYGNKYRDSWAWGTISMWGEVHEHEHGYRSEFAKVKSVTNAASEELFRDLTVRYAA